MASYWQAAKREAKRLARIEGYCYVWSNPNIDWKKPYLFHASDCKARPPWVPFNASLFGEGLYHGPAFDDITPTDRQETINLLLMQEIGELKRLLRSQ